MPLSRSARMWSLACVTKATVSSVRNELPSTAGPDRSSSCAAIAADDARKKSVPCAASSASVAEAPPWRAAETSVVHSAPGSRSTRAHELLAASVSADRSCSISGERSHVATTSAARSASSLPVGSAAAASATSTTSTKSSASVVCSCAYASVCSGPMAMRRCSAMPAHVSAMPTPASTGTPSCSISFSLTMASVALRWSATAIVWCSGAWPSLRRMRRASFSGEAASLSPAEEGPDESELDDMRVARV